MRIGSLLALTLTAVAIALFATAAFAGPGPVRRGYQPTPVMRVTGHPMQLARIGLSTSYQWAQPGCAPVATVHTQPWA